MQGALFLRTTYAMEFTLFHIQPNFYVPPHRKHYCLQYYNNGSNRCCQAQKKPPSHSTMMSAMQVSVKRLPLYSAVERSVTDFAPPAGK